MQHDGQLSEKEIAKVFEWIETQCPILRCNSCGAQDWEVADYMAEVPVYSAFQTTGLRVGVTSYPAALIFCGRCGQMKFFSAVKIGVFFDDAEIALPPTKEADNAQSN